MKIIVYALMAAVLAMSALIGYQFDQIQKSKVEAVRSTCQAVSRVDNTLIGLIRNSDKTLSGFAYYREHPDELARAYRANDEAIQALQPPKYC